MFGWGRKKQEAASEPRVLGLAEVEAEIDRVLGEEAGRLVDRVRSLREAVEGHMSEMVRVAAQMESERSAVTSTTGLPRWSGAARSRCWTPSASRPATGSRPVSRSTRCAPSTRHRPTRWRTWATCSARQTRVIHVFAKKHAARLKEILETYSEDAKSASEAAAQVRGLRVGPRQGLGAAAPDTQRPERRQRGARPRESLVRGGGEDGRRGGRQGGGRREFRETDRYRRYAGVLSEMESLEKKRKSTELSVGAVTAPISKAVSKYRYGSSLDKAQLALAGAMLESPLDAFVKENRADIAQILANTKKAVENGHMSVKDPAKTASCLDEAASRLDEMISRVLEYSDEKRRLESELASSDIGQMRRDEAAAERARADAELARARAAEALAEAEALEARRPELVAELSSAASRLCGSACRVQG